MPEEYQWKHTRAGAHDEHVLHLTKGVEGCVTVSGAAAFEAALIDHAEQAFVWIEQYETLAAAKRGLIAAAKRLGYLSREDAGETERPAAQIDQGPRSIWEWEPEIFSQCTWIEGNGLGIDGVVTEGKDDVFQGDVVLGVYVFREEYPDEWSAKRGVITRANSLIEQSVCYAGS